MVKIGRHTYQADVQFRYWTPSENITIGSFCSIADQVTIFAGGQHRTDLTSTYPLALKLMNHPGQDPVYKTTKDTIIGNDVWIGTKSLILGGIKIGHGAVIATASVVCTDVPPYAIVAGNPATIIRYRFSQSLVDKLLKINWWDWPDETIKNNIAWFYKPANEFVTQFEIKQ